MPPNFGVTLFNALLNFIYPAFCAFCNAQLQTDEKLFCNKCWQLPQPVESSALEELTATRIQKQPPIQKIISLWWFDDFVKAAIHEMKYKRKLSVATKLGKDLAEAILNNSSFRNADFLIPIPLHKSKQRERGYNQSLLLAKAIAHNTGIGVGNKIVKRAQKTKTQTKLSAEQRMKNVSAAFELIDGDCIKNKSVILVDDVCTTGATLFACANALAQAECSGIYALTVAKAPDFERVSQT